MAVILVSNCLLGCACRYSGDDCRCEEILKLAEHHTLIGVCPEQMGGLPTPRDPAEIVGDRLITCSGRDVTENYKKGSEIALHLAKLNHVDFAILKYKSPACGTGTIYDGSFSGRLVQGSGVFSQLVQKEGIPCFTENELDQLPL